MVRKSSAGAIGRVSLNSSTAAAYFNHSNKPGTAASGKSKRRSQIRQLLQNPRNSMYTTSAKTRGNSISHHKKGTSNSLTRAIDKAGMKK